MFTPNNAKLAELHALISVLKVISSEETYEAIKECQLSCGGLGYSQYSGFNILLTNMIVQLTWEGDNNVLLQQTGKYLLDIYKNKMKGKQMKATATCEWVTTEPVIGL